MILIVFLFSACLVLSFDFCGPSRLTRLVILVFTCLFCFTNLFIFSLLVALYSYMELHLACFLALLVQRHLCLYYFS